MEIVRGKFSLFTNFEFVKLWANQILLQIAFNMANFTGLLLIDQVTNSRFALAQFYAAMTLPAFVVGLLAGSVVDLYSRKKMIVGTNITLALLFIAYSFVTHHYWGILSVAFLSAAVAQFFTPAEAATIPLIVKERDLERANALFLFTGLGSVMVGYALAGPIIQLFGGLYPHGAQAAYMISAVLVFIGLLLTSSLKTIKAGEEDKIDEKLLARAVFLTREVIQVAQTNYRILIPVALLTLIEFNTGMLAILFIDYIKEYLNLPSTSISYFLILPLIIGLVLGIELMSLLHKRWGKAQTILIGAITFGLVIFALGAAGQLALHGYLDLKFMRMLTVASSALVGVCVVFIAVNARTILQESTPRHMLGRVFSLVTVSASAVTPIPVLLVALITEKVDVTLVFISFGFVLAVSSWILKPILRKRL